MINEQLEAKVSDILEKMKPYLSKEIGCIVIITDGKTAMHSTNITDKGQVLSLLKAVFEDRQK